MAPLLNLYQAGDNVDVDQGRQYLKDPIGCKSNMDDLPTELLDLIIAYCDNPSQKALRCVNRHLNSLATPPVFEHFYIAPCIFGDTLNNLEKLFRSQQNLAQHVKHLHFCTDILPPWDRHEFEAKAAQNLKLNHRTAVPAVSGRTPSDDDKALASAWQIFESLRVKQTEYFYENDFYLRNFKETISSLPNLATASASIALPFQGSTARWPIWRRLKRSTLISPDDWMFDGEADYRHNDNRMAQTSRAILNLLEAIGFRSSFSGIKQVTELKIHALSNGRWKSLLAGYTSDDSELTDFAPFIETRFQTLLAAFTHLTHLDLQIPHPVTETSRTLSYAEHDRLMALSGAETCTILAGARNLKSLKLAYDGESESASAAFWEPGEEKLHPLYALFAPESGMPPWPKLERLDLSVNVPYTLLLWLLKLLAPTLRRLELRDMCVYDAQALFAELPRVVKLESVYLECLWTKTNPQHASSHLPPRRCILCSDLDANEPYERSLKAYLLRQAETLPRLPAETLSDDGEAIETTADGIVGALQFIACG